MQSLTVSLNTTVQHCALRRSASAGPSAVLLIVLVALICGCGPGRPEMVTVHGKVTFDGQPPPGPGVVFFAQVSRPEGRPQRPGLAQFDESGEYQVGSFDRGDGLVPGSYRVTVECWKDVPTMGAAGTSYVGSGFEPPTIEVPEDASQIEVPIDVLLAN